LARGICFFFGILQKVDSSGLRPELQLGMTISATF
jgi:hypothetical protein